jgi:hypothetical protein
MARFYGSINGSSKSTATKIGTTNSGISAHIRGWDIGVRVEGRADDKDRDTFIVYVTRGSNSPGSGQPLLKLRLDEAGLVEITHL